MINNLLLSGAGGSSKCRTVDVCDIFGDGSGKALYRLDGNANDESGNYHGTETAITYGGGAYERGAVFNGSSSKIDITSLPSMGTSNAVSFYINTATTASQGFIEYSNGTNLIAIYHTSTTLAVRVNALLYTVTTTLPKSLFNHLVISFAADVPTLYLNGTIQTLGSVGSTAIAGTTGLRLGVANVATVQTYTNGSIDQVRIFNRAITATEVATLYAECAPTSTVDDINPFMDGSLKALYQFNGDATDATGVYNGTATNVTYGTGKFGQCAIVTSGKIDLGTKLLAPSTSSYSVSCFMKKVSGQRSTLFSRMNTAVTYGDTLFFETNNTFVLQMPNSSTTHGVNIGSTSTTILDDLQFHFICITLDRVNLKGKLYIDGTLFYTWTIIATSYDNNLNVLIGADHNVSRTGIFDQHRFFNKALTPLEVAALYNETTPLEEPMHKLVDPFKDGSGKALYRLEGNALDESGNYNGTATSVVYGNGLSGRCAVFDGTSSYIATGILQGNTFSYSFWLKTTSTANQAFISDAGATGSGTTANCQIFVQAGNMQIDRLNSNRSLGSFTPYANNTYNHFVVSVSTTEVLTYINGVLFDTWAKAAGSPTTNPVMIGRIGGYNGYYVNGSMDQVRIFNRALTAGEVATLYTEI